MQSADRIGARVKLRDLRVLVAVANAGSISRAAEQLAISHPAVSRTISDLEYTLGVRLFDRSARGIEPTMYGRAFLDCGVAVFDDLRRGVQRLEFLSDPASGEVRIGSSDVMMAGFIPAIIDRLGRKHPRMVFHTIQGDNQLLGAVLRERKVDLVITRRTQTSGEDDFVGEVLFDDPLRIVAGPRNRWIGRRKLGLADLFTDPWILPTLDSSIGLLIVKGLNSIGLGPPRSAVISNSIPLRNHLLATGRYLSILPHSMLQFGARQLRVKILPVTLPGIDQPFELVTLKNRSLSPAVMRFIECARDVAKSLAKGR